MPEAVSPAVRPWARAAGQIALYGAFALAIGVFSQWPRYRPLEPGRALVKLSFTHPGRPVGDCRPLSDAERVKLPPNMRPLQVCPRERSPVVVRVDIAGERVLEHTVPPAGLAKDGPSSLYRRIVVPAGAQRIAVTFSDDVRRRDAPLRREATVTLAPGQVLVIDYDATKGGITFQGS